MQIPIVQPRVAVLYHGKIKSTMKRRLGVHTSIAGGVHLSLNRAKMLGCTTMQIFSHNPRGWSKRSIGETHAAEFRRLSEEYNISPVFIHASYLINIASPDSSLQKKSIDLLIFELRMADKLGVPCVVLHPGKAVGQDTAEAILKASCSLREVNQMVERQSGLLLENTAGQKGDIASSIPLMAEIIEASRCDLVKGICIDTCHAYAAGYNITGIEGLVRLTEEVHRYLSPLRVELIHLNDSRKALSSGIDRHEHIGRGEIGMKGISTFLASSYFKGVPLILETPKDSDRDDVRNLQKVRRILRDLEG